MIDMWKMQPELLFVFESDIGTQLNFLRHSTGLGHQEYRNIYQKI